MFNERYETSLEMLDEHPNNVSKKITINNSINNALIICVCANILRTLLNTKKLWMNILIMLLEEHLFRTFR